MHIGSRLVWWMLAGNDHAAAGDFVADQFRRELLAPGDDTPSPR